MLRNEIIKQVGELRDEIAYQRKLPADKREVDVAQEAMQAALKCFDDYFKLAPPSEYKLARAAVTGVDD